MAAGGVGTLFYGKHDGVSNLTLMNLKPNDLKDIVLVSDASHNFVYTP